MEERYWKCVVKAEAVLDRTKWKGDIGSVVLRLRPYWTGQSGREILEVWC